MEDRAADDNINATTYDIELQKMRRIEHQDAHKESQQSAGSDDNAQMGRLGKKQEFDRNFQMLSITAFSVVAMGGWMFVPNNAFWGLVDGNTGGTITMYLVNFATFATIIMSLAEMSSMAPTAGGQYHWVSEFAPRSLQKPLSYVAGWLSVLAWCCGSTSGFFLAGNLVQAIIVEMHPREYNAEAWKGYLFVFTLTTLGTVVNTHLSRKLPYLEGMAFVLTFAGFASILIVLWILSAGDQLSASTVFGTFTNTGGWSSLGLAMVSGQTLMVWTLTGSDATAHMAEETRNSSLVIPKAMVLSYIVNGVMVFGMLITYCFCLTDFKEAVQSPTGYPFIAVFANATGSSAGGAGVTLVIVVLITFSVTNYMTSCSRQVFAFGRDKGLPCGAWISQVDPCTGCPLHAVLVSYAFCVLISLISLGSSVAFNAITSLQLLALVFTYLLSIGCLVWRRLFGDQLPHRKWTLGRLGMPINLFAIVYSLYLVVFIPFPTELPITLTSVNWAPVMLGAVIVLALGHYLIYARRFYDGPAAYVAATIRAA